MPDNAFTAIGVMISVGLADPPEVGADAVGGAATVGVPLQPPAVVDGQVLIRDATGLLLLDPNRVPLKPDAAWQTAGDFLLSEPLSGLLTRTRVAGWAGVVFALPVLLWQLWRFIVPALHAKEKKYAIPFILSSVGLFLFGCYIAWIVYPKSLEFLVGYAGKGVTPIFTADKYIGLLTLMMLAFGVAFLFPVLLVFLQLVNIVTPRRLMGWWRQALVGILVIAAVITPSGDLPSLVAMAVPMEVFYFAAAGIGWLLTRKRPKTALADE